MALIAKNPPRRVFYCIKKLSPYGRLDLAFDQPHAGGRICLDTNSGTGLLSPSKGRLSSHLYL